MNTRAKFSALLGVQWEHQRNEIIVATIAAAMVAPATLWVSIQRLDNQGPLVLLQVSQLIGLLSSSGALVLGFLLSLRPYALDARAKHTYVLSLPVERTEYSLLRVGSGLTLAILPTIGFLIGSIVAAQSVPSFYELRAFPVALSIRFLLAITVAFGVGFGIQYGLGKRAARLVVLTIVTVGAFELIGQLVARTSLTEPLWELISSSYSPFRIFFTRWMLFDV